MGGNVKLGFSYFKNENLPLYEMSLRGIDNRNVFMYLKTQDHGDGVPRKVPTK